MKIVAIIQARMGSTRLPGKVLKKIVGLPAIEILLARLSRSELINEICVATSHNIENDQLCNAIEKIGYRVIRGSETDVLRRFCDAADATSAEIIVRITGDCPVVDPKLVDKVIELYLESNVDYASNIDPPTFPDGLDVEVFTKATLDYTWNNASRSFDLEHVTPFMRSKNLFKRHNIFNPTDWSEIRASAIWPHGTC